MENRRRELRFRETNPDALRALAGQWVVLEGEAIVASGKHPLEVVSEARAKGIRAPYIFYLEEPPKEDVVWIGL